MFDHKRSRTSLPVFFTLALFVLALVPMIAAAKSAEKTYPMTGKVVGMGQNQSQVRTAPGPNGGSRTVYFHTYKVETESRIYDLDCEKAALVHNTGKECGGDQPLDIRSVLQFRIEKGEVYIQLPDAKEQKLRILSEDAKPEPKPADAPASDTK
jgi:hypothetical protein